MEVGDSVGYGGEWTAAEDTTIATLPLGYADGIPREFKLDECEYESGVRRPYVHRDDLLGRAFFTFFPFPPFGDFRPRFLP